MMKMVLPCSNKSLNKDVKIPYYAVYGILVLRLEDPRVVMLRGASKVYINVPETSIKRLASLPPGKEG